MSDVLLTTSTAAEKLGITVTTLYDWLSQSDRGDLVIRGENVTVDYLQGGPKGQGKIVIEASEVTRIRNLMRVRPQTARCRRHPMPRGFFPGVNVPLGRTNEFPDA
jgi:transposase-like protein